MTNFNSFHYFSITEIFSQNDKDEILDILSNQNISDNMHRLLEFLDGMRTLFFDKPIYITSFYRNKQHNQNVGGVANSYHMFGAAVDVTCPDIAYLLSELSDWKDTYKYIYYPDKNFVHVQLKDPKK